MDSNFVFFVLHVSCIRSPKIYPAGDFFVSKLRLFAFSDMTRKLSEQQKLDMVKYH